MDKQQQIEELSKELRLIKELQASNIYTPNYQEAMALISLGYQKIKKGSVVLSKEEYEDLKYKESLLSKTALITKEELLMIHDNCNQARKQAIKEVLEIINEEIYQATKSNHRAVIERMHKHNSCIAEDDFCQRCKGKIEALSGINNYINKIAKKFEIKPDFTNHTSDPDWN